ncbi:hypothetical protein K492DRAFT_139786 [Lichtheimia hyalospora FSU 10163]|nr:hypothetical protein K492DRAFT_139786 [Lichtheimia hyalospora FSU 10163]
MGVLWTDDEGQITMGGAMLALLCVYLLGMRIVRMLVFQSAGPTVMRPRTIVQVVVLGDIGRSPRIRSHAVSLAEAGCQVDLIGYAETSPGTRVNANRHITVRKIIPAWSVPEGLPRLVYIAWAPFKAIFVALQLAWIMGCITQRPNYILIQNPPAIPTLAIAQGVSKLRDAKLVIDWHNFGFSILGIKLGMNHPVVQLAKRYEQYLGRHAYAHLTVTDRMNRELKQWDMRGKMITFHDRPPYHFERLSAEKKHDFLSRVQLENIVKQQTLAIDKFLDTNMDRDTTLLTKSENGSIVMRDDNERVRLIVSSTSWTEDEDFSILLKAVELYESASRKADKPYPRLLFVITGKGPLKNMYEQKISSMHLERTRIITAWLEVSDYPLLLGSADLGISLHTSTSGMDLPMKVVDMFGCGLAVCALSFECLDELVQDDKNGLIFSSSTQLAEQWIDVFVRKPGKLDQLRMNVIAEYKQAKWEKQWNEIVAPLFGIVNPTTVHSKMRTES